MNTIAPGERVKNGLGSSPPQTGRRLSRDFFLLYLPIALCFLVINITNDRILNALARHGHVYGNDPSLSVNFAKTTQFFLVPLKSLIFFFSTAILIYHLAPAFKRIYGLFKQQTWVRLLLPMLICSALTFNYAPVVFGRSYARISTDPFNQGVDQVYRRLLTPGLANLCHMDGFFFIFFFWFLVFVTVLRWAESSHSLQAAAARYGVNVPQPEPMSPEKLACIFVSIILLNAFGLWTIRASEHLSIRHWWLLWALLLAILYASYGARYEQTLWYPYDIPHLVFFGLATAFILADRPLPFVAAFLVDAPTRETSIFLIAVALLVHLKSKTWRIAIAACAVIWMLTRLLAQHFFPDGPHQWNGLHWYTMIKPWHLPQLFSIAGFLWLPVWLGIKYLIRQERLALYAATAMIFLTFFFATWNETRAWSEWSVLFAILGAVQLERAFASPASQR